CPDGQIVVVGEIEGLMFALNDGDWQTSNTFQNLTAGEYVVHARDEAGCTQSLTVVLTACDAPSNITVTQATPTSVALSWNAAFGATGYTVRYRPFMGGTWAYWNGSGTSATITGLTPQIRYVMQVQTRCADDASSLWSSNVLVATPAEPLPQCTNAQWVAITPGVSSTYLEWTSVPAATHYHIQYKRANVSGVWTTVNVVAPITSLTIPTQPGVQYQLRIRTRCGTTTLPWLEQILFTTPSVRVAENGQTSATMSLYPNPSHGVFEVKFDAPEGRAVIDVYDAAGKLVLTREIFTRT
ncbi:MAG: fibronectin type III domain-containing protein, partial [Bacteroidia bacterium]|nr:fibronectin type III domain-containing protein [Bacteroidia bacterium]